MKLKQLKRTRDSHLCGSSSCGCGLHLHLSVRIGLNETKTALKKKKKKSLQCCKMMEKAPESVKLCTIYWHDGA